MICVKFVERGFNWKKINLVIKLINIGYTIKEAWQFVNHLAPDKSWRIIENPGLVIINSYAEKKIIVSNV